MNFKYLSEIFFLIGDNKKKLPLMCILFIFLSFLDLAGIGLIAPYVTLIANPEQFMRSDFFYLYNDLGFSTQITDLIINIGVILIFVFFMKTLLSIFINSILLKFCHNQCIELRALLMRSYQDLSYVDFTKNNTSSYIHNINLAEKFSTGTLLAFLRLICDGIVVIAIVVFLAISDVTALTILVLLLLSLALLYDKFFKPKLIVYGELSNQSSINIYKSIQEAMNGLKEIRILEKEDFFFKSMYESAFKFADIAVKSAMINLSPKFLLELLMMIFVVSLVFSTEFTNRSYTDLLPLLSVFGIAGLKLIPASNSIISGITKMRFFRDAVSLLCKDVKKFENSSSPMIGSYRKDLDNFESLKLNNIEFGYPGTKNQAIKSLSLAINKNDTIGIIGASGSGKTTLIDIILGLLEPQSGEIIYNKSRLNEISIHEWRSKVAYLPQEIFLMDDSLKKNIALGIDDNQIDSNKVYESIKKARLEDLVENLPSGINTFVGERGARLSGGQKQRIALARAFYHEREILIMDESTSSLDTETEQQIVDEIGHLKGSKTIVVIAHRLSTLQHCNIIYNIEGGKVTKSSSYKDLMESIK